tara:strand:+ start:14587 stop:15396 length:810 start_codon:yes stop_codon:yes gene_type:complete
MSIVHKDRMGTEIKLGDYICHRGGGRHSSWTEGFVTRMTPCGVSLGRLSRVDSEAEPTHYYHPENLKKRYKDGVLLPCGELFAYHGSNVSKDNIIVLTAQVVANNGIQWYSDTKASYQHLIDAEAAKPVKPQKVKKTITARIMSKTPDKNFIESSGVTIEIKLFHDKKLVGEGLSTNFTKDLGYGRLKTLVKGTKKDGWRQVSNAKLSASRWGANQSERTLSMKAIKPLLGDNELVSSIVVEFNTIEELIETGAFGEYWTKEKFVELLK